MTGRPDTFNARRQRGLTLIELMVALVIGMVLTLAVFGVLAAWEGKKRVTTGLNDLEQAGNLALYQLDQWVRSAGSGFSSTAAAGNSAYGCLLRASAESGQILPRTSALPAPFASVDLDGDGNFPMLPVMIVPDATTPGESGEPSDALLVMGGSAHHGGAALSLSADATDSALSLESTLGFGAGDLLLLFDVSVGNRCLLTQVASSAATSLTLDANGSFYADEVDDTSLAASFKKGGLVMPLGSPTTDPPQFQLIGVGDHNTLYSYDLLETGGTDQALQARAEGVFEMHALYGVDTNGDREIDQWVSASSGSDFAADKLMAGTPAARKLILQIKAIRVGLILRTTLPEKTAEETSTASTLYLFKDLDDGLRYERALSGDALKYRYRVMEATLVLRNNMVIKY